MYSVIDVARYIINYAYDNDIVIHYLKLQKILYFVQLQFLLNNHNNPCFKENIYSRNVVIIYIPEVNKEFHRYGLGWIPRIKEYYDISDGLWNIKKVKYVTKISPTHQKIINSVVNECNKYGNLELGNIITKQSPYIESLKKSNRIISVNSLIGFINQYIK